MLVELDPRAQLVDVHAINTGRSLVGLHPRVGAVEVLCLAHPFHEMCRQGALSAFRRERLRLPESGRLDYLLAAWVGARRLRG
jgi:hypothetical protein